ncbi:hypothetical protein [Metallosphaera hakonensis]|uniref:Uncharacterized protein n=1 Tax=Metallosphaera hakonensis JCM 8857 = DSM 7519 TaxID=1293036 RepID=A0A2U9IUX9_9CREN|nr:hypothetical protein [Metallosphaera hakonensis]AWR99762.1 hypothetical protein DFR87_08735 [Metallosphaera hakonensis JCM 8857 = DSM 7519]
MRISETTNKYLLKKGNFDLIVEEVKNEKGERFFSIGSLKSTSTASGESWQLDTSSYKTIDRKNLDADLKKLLSLIK